MATTPVYNLPYQALEDAPHGPNLGQDLAEAVETEFQRLDTIQTVTTGFTASTGFTTLAFRGIRAGAVHTIKIHAQVTTTITLDSSGNLPDKQVGTLPSGWYDATEPTMIFGDNGLYIITGIINVNGTVTLRAAGGNISASTSVRLTATYVK